MEAVERFSALPNHRFTVRGSLRYLRTRFEIAHPTQFIVPGSRGYKDDDVIEWVSARSLVHDDVVLVPAAMAFSPDIPTDRSIPRMRGSSNGLASGNTLEEATLHALYELIERDADVISTYSGVGERVDLANISDAVLSHLVAVFARHKVELRVRRVTQDIPIHTFRAVAIDHDLRRVDYVNGGHGTHLDPRVALTRAITEAAQSRVTVMAGIREDMPSQREMLSNQDFDALRAANYRELDDGGGACDFDSLEDMSQPSLTEDLQRVVDELMRAGVPDVLVVDLTRPEVGIPVVRALVPTLEFEMPGNWIGPRLLRHWREPMTVR
jgi:ribosomal protein S12 methylthiotransferase accessory factor